MRNTQMSDRALDAEATALASLVAGGWLRIYGDGQPDSGNEPAGARPLLSEHRLTAPAFKRPVRGEIEALPIQAAIGLREGNATWFRFFEQDGVAEVWDGSIGTADANIIFEGTTRIVPGVLVRIKEFRHTLPAATPGY